jgi:hypothetical protein
MAPGCNVAPRDSLWWVASLNAARNRGALRCAGSGSDRTYSSHRRDCPGARRPGDAGPFAGAGAHCSAGDVGAGCSHGPTGNADACTGPGSRAPTGDARRGAGAPAAHDLADRHERCRPHL